MTTNTETRVAHVFLSGFHAGQIVEPRAKIRAEGRYVPDGRDASGRPRTRWVATRWQAVHTTVDHSRPVGHPERKVVTESPWFGTLDEAERWLTDRGIIIAGPYWFLARAK